MIYNQVIKSKNGLSVPVFNSGRPSFSKYNPQRDGEIFCNNLNKSSFFLIAGLSSGIHIHEIFKKYPESFVLVIEESQEDIFFLKENCPEVQELFEKKNFFVTDKDKLEECLINLYLPALFDSFSFAEYRPWAEENPERMEEIRTSVKNALERIRLDFSTQARFGKLWQRNILENLVLYKKKYSLEKDYSIKMPDINGKTAIVLAAGPSLEKNLDFIKKNRKEYFVIASDTALGPALKNKIIPDAAVSIDGQAISHSHFMNKKALQSIPLFIFDLNANPSAVRIVAESRAKILFSSSFHPLTLYAERAGQKVLRKKQNFEKNTSSFLKLESGSGTVTISALDFAFKAGFSKIIVLGADFAYSGGKSYASGTYLDRIYNQNSSKITNSESLYSKLYFRSPLYIKERDFYSTGILKSYEDSFENYLKVHNLSEKNSSTVRIITCKSKRESLSSEINIFNYFNLSYFNYDNFIAELRKDLSEMEKNLQVKNIELIKKSPLFFPFLPYISKDRANKVSLTESLKLAIDDIKRYT